MNTENIKLELLEWLKKLNDKFILTSLLQFKKASEAADWYDQLTVAQRESLSKGLEEIEKGNTMNSGQFWASYGRKI